MRRAISARHSARGLKPDYEELFDLAKDPASASLLGATYVNMVESAEVIDPRTLRPLDLDTILESVRKTNRCVIVEEGWPHGGVGANLAGASVVSVIASASPTTRSAKMETCAGSSSRSSR